MPPPDGFNVSDLSQPLHCDDLSTLSPFEKDYCETNLPLRGQFKHAWLPSWSPGKKLDADSMQRNGMDGSIVRPLPAHSMGECYSLSLPRNLPLPPCHPPPSSAVTPRNPPHMRASELMLSSCRVGVG